jgi:nitrile hydratase subunit beta
MCSVFTAGERVRARVMNPAGHTRLPAYLRGRPGRIERVLGTFRFPAVPPGTAAPAMQTAYTVRFEASDVWGADGDPRGSICADLFESHLEACE